ncbi:aldose 1-epimerase family protein [Latilactobacillus fuchuensis]|uniref:aldose 1-epimerase family protein n=1 Tax=Latilactobacillus fuchuensis TaxID=164393 RepID=UPI0020C80BA3|nr:aldose 1-epimerase family protein [Latilactobacillus fuchuensis]MCP8857157.1 aldose 1-epimerase family protein [Latilactobacillus fuchuensis]
MVQIANEFLTVEINPLGAELTSLKGNVSGLEYLWQADPAVWKRHAPVLFPFVGRSKNDQYTYQGKTYPMGQHGFARDRQFEVEESGDQKAVFLLKSDEVSLAIYPFEFELRVSYQVQDMHLVVNYDVKNTATTAPMYFSIGGHPGFKVPMTADTQFDDYFVDYRPQKSRVKIPLQGAFINLNERTLAPTDVATDISHDLFKDDAMIYELKGQENVFSIRSEKTPHAISMKLSAPFIGVWSPHPTEGNLVCLEPWWGIADDVAATGELSEKFGVNQLAPQATFNANYEITVK